MYLRMNCLFFPLCPLPEQRNIENNISDVRDVYQSRGKKSWLISMFVTFSFDFGVFNDGKTISQTGLQEL